MSPRRRIHAWALWAVVALGIAGLVAYTWWLLAGSPKESRTLFDLWVYNGVLFLAALVCFLRAFTSPELRGAWVSFGLGLTAWALGDVYWVVALADVKHPPYPSLADAGYLLTLPCLFAGIALLVKHRGSRFMLASWFDGAIGALGAAAVATALLAPALIGLSKGDTAVVFTNLAYPVGDLVLVAFIVGAVIVGGLRGAGPLLLVGTGLLVWTSADMFYLHAVATNSYHEGEWVDIAWLVGALLMGASAALSASRGARPRDDYKSSLLVPMVSTTAAVGVLVWDHFDRISLASVWLSAATMIAVAARLWLSSRENVSLMSALRSEAVTDALTGLGNRRQLMSDLEDLLHAASGSGTTHVLALFDLDGFKAYNDSFGHPAGDALLRRLGGRLASGIGPNDAAYRLGGDEFCVIFDVAARNRTEVVELARAALSEQGEGFVIGASCGVVELPREAKDASEALQAVDQRMYVEKGRHSLRARQQTQDVLLHVLREREPALGSHLDDVADLARAIAQELSLSAEEVDAIFRAAELHDIGKIAIPDSVLRKPGPLDANEWELMHRHTLIGERILGAAPALRPVATLVRSTHERWDGGGYPDGLAGEEIPLGARIIFICDAFDVMTSPRPYQASLSEDEALAELRRNAGAQFDPRIVEIFCRLVERGHRPPTREDDMIEDERESAIHR